MDAKTLSLYLGCEVLIKAHDGIARARRGTLTGFHDPNFISARIAFRAGQAGIVNCNFFKLLLRPLSSMTEEEFKEFSIEFFSGKELVFANEGKTHYQ